jgi:hypothetical protein
MQRLITGLAGWGLRVCATMTALAGAALLIAGLPVLDFLSGEPAASAAIRSLLWIGATCVTGGGAALYLSRPGRPAFPNERAEPTGAERPEVGGWLIAMAIALFALPVAATLALRSFLSEWRWAVDLMSRSGLWEGANANMSGVLLMPVFAALTPALIELTALAAVVGASAVSMALLLARSPRFPRLYLICAVLMAAWVIASVLGVAAAARGVDAVRQLIATSETRGSEVAMLHGYLNRYTTAVFGAAPILVMALLAYLIWTPWILTSRRAVATFAPEAPPSGVEAITRPPGA